MTVLELRALLKTQPDDREVVVVLDDRVYPVDLNFTGESDTDGSGLLRFAVGAER